MNQLGAILLAAGASRRFGEANKLLADLGGKPLLCHVADAILKSGAADIVVVTGHDREAVEAALARLPLRFVHNEDWSTGMGRSIARGVRALRPDTHAAFVVPGDMPNLTAAFLAALAGRYRDAAGEPIVVPTTAEGEQRNPVLWPRRFFDRLGALDGPKGGKDLLERARAETTRVPVSEASVFADIDTPSDLPSE